MLFLKYVGRNDLSHSDCGIFKSTISPQQIDETALFFSMLIQIHKNQKLIEKVLVGHGQK